MLIQHGSEDRRVPLSNATELYRGLKEMGVPVELFIFLVWDIPSQSQGRTMRSCIRT